MDAVLAALGVDPASIEAVVGGDAQWQIVRKSYLKECLRTHPDKLGGCDASFNRVQSAFETAKRAVERSGRTVAQLLASGAAVEAVAGEASTKAYSFYKSASDTDAPAYKVEAAKSGRSCCVKCKNPIDMGALRVGSLDAVSGSYRRWTHLGCLKIPGLIQAAISPDASPDSIAATLKGLDGVAILGISALSADALAQIAAHISDRTNWAKTTASSVTKLALHQQRVSKPAQLQGAVVARDTQEPRVPVAGVDGLPGALKGQTVVLTGVFPIEGGVGLQRGKDGLKNLIESHGGKVTGSVSKKTSLLCVGEQPGMSKVESAVTMGVKLVNLSGLFAIIRGTPAADVEPPEVKSFSRGFGGNGLAKLKGNEATQQLKFAVASKRPLAIAGPVVSDKRARDHESGSSGDGAVAALV